MFRRITVLLIVLLLIFWMGGFALLSVSGWSNGGYNDDLELQSVEHFIDVPFQYQDTEYYCGPACLEMIFDYYGEDINQSEIADVARTFYPDGTYTDELRRAAHFSNLSTSMGAEILDENITGYTLRKLGYAAFEAYDMDLTQLKSYIDQDKPLILLMRYSEASIFGHYRVAVGYNETYIFLHDPWAWGGSYGGPNIALNYTLFSDLWSYSGYWALYTLPWTINVSAPTYIKPQTPFQINATITYPQAPTNSFNNYSASSCNATIILPINLTLAQGETQKKPVGTGSLEAGANSAVSWMLTTNYSGTYAITLEVEGLVSGSVAPHGEYPAYGYIDRIGATVNFTMELEEDSNIPVIGIPSRVPEDQVQPYQDVKVSVNVTDAESGVKNATLFFTINNGATWENRTMNYNQSTSLYEAIIPGQQAGTWVRFKIVAYDYLGNNATRDGTEPYCVYQVIPEFPPNLTLLILAIFTMPTLLYIKKKKQSQLIR